MKYNFAQTIIDQSLRYPSKIAYQDGSNNLTYGQLTSKIKQIAQGLNMLGISKGDRVIILMEDNLDWPPTFLACVYLGIVPMAVSVRLPVNLLYKIIDFIDCKLIITDQSMADKLIDLHNTPIITKQTDLVNFYKLPGDIESATVYPDAPGFMSLSSGTTGTPKIGVQRHQVFYEVVKFMPISYNMTHDSIIMSTPKMSWGFGLHNSITITVGLGATAIIIPAPPSPSLVFKYLNAFRPTIVSSTPAVIKKLVGPASTKYTMPDSIVTFTSSSEDLTSQLYDEFLEKFNIRLETILGMLEVGGSNYTSTLKTDHKKGTVGKPFPGIEVKIVQDDNICGTNQIGEIYVNSTLNAFCYYNNYKSTKETFIGPWVKTNDYGYWDTQGNIVFVGRGNDIFKVNDLIVSPMDIEESIEKHPAIIQAGVVGINNKKSVPEVHAFVVVNTNFELEKFKEFLSANLLPHQIPKHIHILDSLPITVTDKKDRKSLSTMYAN
jgi:benzoate-CoA ligase